ncbi:MAG: leucine--tRNA ligase [Bdellovibrionaceae bacterium]|nr:leucine--tRNA ligase [Pseudobdellovibrionaceae bacterium]
MSQYNAQSIEKKWQEKWDTEKTYKCNNPGDKNFDSSKPSYYVLDMFPYPSGSGLHVGHASGYVGTDIIARKKRMDGFNVLHPMGWDAFGLPAEQYAIQTGQHPRVTTEVNANNFRKQLKLLGLSYDWDREIDTSLPEYYKWTQWLFLKLYEKGLVYQKEVAVWWCEDLKTVLANEEVINGRSERGNYPCVRRPLKQWVLKITEYADRLLSDLDLLDWPDHIKKMQSDWIGRSEGAEIDFVVENSDKKIRVFSTRVDTIFGVTAVVLAPEHPWVKDLTTEAQKTDVQNYLNQTSAKSERDRQAEVKEISGTFTGSYAYHPLIANKKIPIYIADYVIADYGTGAVMSVPAHDERDYRFAKLLELPLIPVIKPDGIISDIECFTEDGVLVNSEIFSGLKSSDARSKITTTLENKKLGSKKITYKLKDWVFSRQRYWGEPFPLSFDESGNIIPTPESELPVVLPEMKDFTPSEDGSSPLARVQDWVKYTSKAGKSLERSTDTMPGWAGSCWYYLRFMDPHNAKEPFSKNAISYWKQVDLYVGGTAHAVMHLLYARFWHKVFFDCNLVPTPEPFKKLFNQGLVTAFAFKDSTGRLVVSDEVENVEGVYKRKSTGETVERFITKMSKSLKNVVNPDDIITSHGCDILRAYEMFMGPLDDEKPWTDDGLPGCTRFLKRTWNLFHDDSGEIRKNLLRSASVTSDFTADQQQIEEAFHKCLKRVNESFVNFNFNTSIAAFMEYLNDISGKVDQMTTAQGENFLRILSPFCPHIAAELWEKTQHNNRIDFEKWPELDLKLAEGSTFELVISLNGKPKKRLKTQRGSSSSILEAKALEAMSDLVSKDKIIKTVVVPDKLVNFVVKS